MKLTVAQLAERTGAELIGDGSGQIIAVGTIDGADENTITFITNERHVPKLKNSRAAAVIVARHIEDLTKPQLIVENVNAALIEVLNIFAPKLRAVSEGIDPSAKIGQNVVIGSGVSVGAGVVIDDGARIGDKTVIASGCRIGEGSTLGRNCRLDSNVVVYHNCYLGNNVIIQANSTIGSIGFGYFFIDGSHKLVPHNGVVVIEDFVEIGANCCIDRAKFGETRIGAGTKIDNLVQIAHNVVVGKCCLILAQVGIAGSCKIGDGVVLAGQAGLVDNIELGNGAVVGAQAGVTHSFGAGQQIFGSPADDSKEMRKVMILTRRLPKLAEQLKLLSKRIEKLESAEDNQK